MSRLCVLAGVVLSTAGFLSADAALAALGLAIGMLGAVEVRRECR
jgi:hypothetical protein